MCGHCLKTGHHQDLCIFSSLPESNGLDVLGCSIRVMNSDTRSSVCGEICGVVCLNLKMHRQLIMGNKGDFFEII